TVGSVGVSRPNHIGAWGGVIEQSTNGDTAARESYSCMYTSVLTEAQIQQRETTQYVDDSPHADMYCSNCQLFTEPEAGAQCGGCQVVPGPIHPEGYCTLWVAQQA